MKLESKFFSPFRVLYPVGKQAYKLALPTKWKIHDVFHVSLQEQDTTRKGHVDKALPEPEKDVKFEARGNKVKRSKQSSTAQRTASRQTAIKGQASTISLCGRATQKKKPLRSLYRQSYISGSWLTLSIRSIRKNRQRPLYLWTPLHQWPDQRF